MAISFHTGDGGEEPGELHDINVTPFIDVMLVLLIIFMIAAPLATVNIKVDLPSASATVPENRPEPPLTLSVKTDGALFLGEDPVTEADLPAALEAATNGDREERLFIHADKDLSYGALMGVVESVRRAGYLKIALTGLEGAGP